MREVDSGAAAAEAAAMKPDVICGLQAVTALFARRPDDAMRLFYGADLRRVVGAWCSVMAAARKPYRMVADSELAKVAGTPHHGGIAVVAQPRMPAVFDPASPPQTPLLLVLDGIGNPHNLGAIARSAAFFGVGGLLLAEAPGAAMPSDAAYRTSEGGLEFLDLWRTDDLAATIAALAPRYLTVAATLADSAATPADLPRDRPIALVLGHEERGISLPVLSACAKQVRIAGSGRVQSLNVAQSAAVLLHALGE